jgi:glycosyltransferase involved in cell wall biosynthesis
MKYCDNVHVVLDAHMTVATNFKADYLANKPFRLVWEGVPPTLGSLEVISAPLKKLASRYDIEIHIVTDRKGYRYLGRYGKWDVLKMARRILPNVHFHEWTELDFADIICSCDLAVIPLQLADPFSAGKPENKLLLFWRMGMPVVTSASKAYVRAMQAAGLELCARDENDWLTLIERLLLDETARRRAGILGRAYTEREFSEVSFLAKWDAVFESVLNPEVCATGILIGSGHQPS